MQECLSGMVTRCEIAQNTEHEIRNRISQSCDSSCKSLAVLVHAAQAMNRRIETIPIIFVLAVLLFGNLNCQGRTLKKSFMLDYMRINLGNLKF